MDINRLTEKAQEALRAAQSEATRLGHQQIDVEHLLLALLNQEGGLTKSILDKTAVDPDLVRRRVEAGSGPVTESVVRHWRPRGSLHHSRLNRLLVQAEDEAKQLKDEYVSVEHLLLAMVDDESVDAAAHS